MEIPPLFDYDNAPLVHDDTYNVVGDGVPLYDSSACGVVVFYDAFVFYDVFVLFVRCDVFVFVDDGVFYMLYSTYCAFCNIFLQLLFQGL